MFGHNLRSILVVLLSAGIVHAGSGVAGGPEHDGNAVDCDLPQVIRVRNTVGTNGMGLCVWASTEMMGRYTSQHEIIGIFEQMKHEPGGGWPARVDKEMHRRPGVKYRQYQGADIAFIQEGINSGRPVCVTYGTGELYGMRTIAHMVLCVGMNDKYTAILDNNDPERIWWMPTPEFQKRFIHPGQSGWAWYTLGPPPPPVPRAF